MKILKQFQNVLSKKFKTTLATSGNDALNKICDENFEVIISDYNMNDGDGLFLLNSLNSKKSKVPLILISGHANSDIAIKFANLHVFKILEKPVSPQELKNVTDEAYFYYLNLKLEEKLKRLGENTAHMLHDVNNNMFLISATAEIGVESSDGFIKNQFERTLNASKKITDIIQRYKNFLNSNEPVTLSKVCANEFVKKFHQDVFSSLKNISFVCETSSDKNYISIDYNLMYQVLMNLVSNSKDSLNDCKNPEIKIGVKSSLDKVYIYVKDNGKGVNKNIKDKLFKERVSTKGNSGTGMGLSYCKKVLEMHLGEIEFVDQSVGACFQIKLTK